MKQKIKLLGLIVLLFLSLFILGCSTQSLTGDVASESASSSADTAASDSDIVSIPLSDVSTSVKFYEYGAGGTIVRYFTVLGSDGQPRVAFDACDVCGGYKGYEQRGTDIVCRNCGRVFSIDGLGQRNKGSGCWPGYLDFSVEGDNIVIKTSDLQARSYMFS